MNMSNRSQSRGQAAHSRPAARHAQAQRTGLRGLLDSCRGAWAARRAGTPGAWLRLGGLSATTHIALPLFAAALLAVIGLSTSHVIETERSAAEAQARAATEEQVEAYQAQVRRHLSTIDQALKTVRYAVGLKGATGALPALNQQGLTLSGLLFTVRIVNDEGVVVASNLGLDRIDVTNESYFRHHRQHDRKATYVSRVQPGLAKGEWLLSFSRRLNDTTGRFAGAVVVAVDPALFTDGYDRARMGKHGALGVYGADGVMRALRVDDALSWGHTAPAGVLTGNVVAARWDGVRRFTAVRAVPGQPLNVMVGLAEREQMAAFEARRSSYLWIASSGSAMLVLIVALLCVWSWQVTRIRGRAQRAEETYAAASKASMDAFFVLRAARTDEGVIGDFLIEEVNARAELLLAMGRDKLVGRLLCEVLPLCRANGLFEDLVAVTEQGGVHEAEWQWVQPPFPERWAHRQVVAVKDGVVAIVRDITERKRTEEHIRHIAHHDELTGLPNRLLVRDRLEQAVLQAGRRQRCAALVFIDLDGFKKVNDTLGHKAGDELLRMTGARMASCLRREDTVGRFGGDEFVLVLNEVGDDPAVLGPLFDKIRTRVNEVILLEGQLAHVGCSMGVAMYPRDGLDADALMRHADAAMYHAKKSGKNRYQFYTRDMDLPEHV